MTLLEGGPAKKELTDSNFFYIKKNCKYIYKKREIKIVFNLLVNVRVHKGGFICIESGFLISALKKNFSKRCLELKQNHSFLMHSTATELAAT